MSRAISVGAVVCALLVVAGGPNPAEAETATPFESELHHLTAGANAQRNADAWRAGGVTATTIFPPDTRTAVPDTTASARRTVAYLLVYDELDNFTHTCSGTLLSGDAVLTAAHCLYDDVLQEWSGSVLVIPGAQPELVAPYGVEFGTRFIVPEGFAEAQDPGEFDLAIIGLDSGGFGNALAPYPLVAAAPDSFLGSPVGLATAGYPGDKNDGSMWTTQTHEYWVDDFYLYDLLDVFFGQSGSGIHTFGDPSHPAYLIGVVSQGNDFQNKSPRITPDWLQALHSYCVELACTFTSKAIPPVSYELSGVAFCSSSEDCPGGPNAVVAGKPVFGRFTVSPTPLRTLEAFVFFDGAPVTSFNWPEPPYAHGNFQTGAFLGSPPAGQLRIDVWSGLQYVGSLHLAVPETSDPPALQFRQSMGAISRD
ncbi:MAG: trypsin-like serine protease [Dehalococcoidia bacterium]